MGDPTRTRRTIMVMRHAEKPDATGQPVGVDAFGGSTVHGLTCLGWARARRLADLFSGQTLPPPFVRPTELYAPNFGGAERERRAYLTLMPTCQALATPIQAPEPEGHEDKLARHLADTSGQSPLVCWEHHHIPAMATALAGHLGITQVTPRCQAWPDDDYATVLVFAESDAGWTLAEVSPGLLPGDPHHLDAPASP